MIGVAWNLALWEVAHETGAGAPVLVVGSPQKNVTPSVKTGDEDLADSTLVEKFSRLRQDVPGN